MQTGSENGMNIGECQCLDCADGKVLESIFSDLPTMHHETQQEGGTKGSTQEASNEELFSDIEELTDDKNGHPYDSKFDHLDDLVFAKDCLELLYQQRRAYYDQLTQGCDTHLLVQALSQVESMKQREVDFMTSVEKYAKEQESQPSHISKEISDHMDQMRW